MSRPPPPLAFYLRCFLFSLRLAASFLLHCLKQEVALKVPDITAIFSVSCL